MQHVLGSEGSKYRVAFSPCYQAEVGAPDCLAPAGTGDVDARREDVKVAWHCVFVLVRCCCLYVLW